MTLSLLVEGACECIDHPSGLEVPHTGVAFDRAGFIFEALFDADATFCGGAYDLDMWPAWCPEVDWACAVAIGVVAEDADGGAADGGGDVHGACVYDDGCACTREGTCDFGQPCFAAQIAQGCFAEELFFGVASVVAFAFDLGAAAEQSYADSLIGTPGDQGVPVFR